MTGIYQITNKINGKKYIGQSVDITSRWRSEKARAFNPSSNTYDTPLSRAFRKYGLKNFTFEVLEECSSAELDEKEINYIFTLKTLTPFGYNISKGGDGSSHPVKLTYDIVLAVIKDLQERKLTQLQIAEKYNISKDSVTDINLGHTWHNPTIVYPIRSMRVNEKEKSYCVICGKEITKGCTYCSECAHKLTRIAERPSAEQLLKEIATSSFVKVGEKYGVTDNAIRKWCKAYGLPTKKKEIVELYKN